MIWTLAHRSVMIAIFMIAPGTIFAHSMAGSAPYLQAVGVPPMRFEAASTNLFVFNPKQFAPEPVAIATNTPSSAVATAPTPAATNSIAANPPTVGSSVETNEVSSAFAPAAEEKNIPGQYFNSVFSGASASDLLPVTPQMITQYLKPEQNEKNRLDQPGTVVFVPAGVQFTPAEPGNTTRGSRATYQTR